MALRPNLPEDQQIVIDGLAADAIRKLHAQLRPVAASDDQANLASSDRAFALW
jgi:hypothetical protein